MEGSAHPAAEVYTRDVVWIEGADVMVAEVSTPSHGVGFEIGHALNLGKPVLALHDQSRTVSKMILGNDAPKLSIANYSNESQAIEAVRSFLNSISE